jgi:di/tricarboxylate transporter
MLGFDSVIMLTILTVMVYLFMTEKLPLDYTALSGLVVVAILGYVTPEEAFSGFSSPTVIMVISCYVLAAALKYSGVADYLARLIYRFARQSETLNIIAVTLVGALVSSMMNNITAATLLMPAISSLALRSRISPGKLFIPLSFGVVLGGTTTLIGTPQNLIVSDVLANRGLEPFHFFDFTPYGLAITIFGTIFLATIGRFLLPKTKNNKELSNRQNLLETYGLKDQVCVLKVPKKSTLDGKRLAELHLPQVFGADVIQIQQDGKEILLPASSDFIYSGDLLFLHGLQQKIHSLLKIASVQISPVSDKLCKELSSTIFTMEIPITDELLAEGKSVSELDFKAKFQSIIGKIRRQGKLITGRLTRLPLERGDLLTVYGSQQNLEAILIAFSYTTEIVIKPVDADSLTGLFTLAVPTESIITKESLTVSSLRELIGVGAIAIKNGKEVELPPSGDRVLKENDCLILSGDLDRLSLLESLGELEIVDHKIEINFESNSIGLLEVVIPPRSQAIGKTLSELSFRDQYGFQALAIWRDGKPVYDSLGSEKIKLGDALLLQGPRIRFRDLRKNNGDFLTLADPLAMLPSRKNIFFAIAPFVLMIGLIVGDILPPELAAVLSALFAISGGLIKMENVYKVVEWRMVFLVGALLPLGIALQKVGITQFIALSLITYGDNFADANNGQIFLLLLCFLLTSSFISQILDSTISSVALAPIAIDVALKIEGLSPHLLVMMVTLGGSLVFMTPFSHRAHLLVMGAGGYKAKNFLIIGSLITVLLLAVILSCALFVFPKLNIGL